MCASDRRLGRLQRPGKIRVGTGVEPDVQPIGDDLGRLRLVIRIFGPLRIEDGERVLGPRDLGGAHPKQNRSEHRHHRGS